MTTLQRLLERLYACEDAREWAGEKSLAEAWETCERADWMLWLAGRMDGKDGWPARKEVILTAIECGRLSLKYAGKYKAQLAEMFDVAERCTKNPTPENIAAASVAAEAASVARAAAEAAWARAGTEAAWARAAAEAHKQMCGIIRKRLAIPTEDE